MHTARFNTVKKSRWCNFLPTIAIKYKLSEMLHASPYCRIKCFNVLVLQDVCRTNVCVKSQNIPDRVLVQPVVNFPTSLPVHSEQPSAWGSIRSRSLRRSDEPGSGAPETGRPKRQHLRPDMRGGGGTGCWTPRRWRSRAVVPQTWVSCEQRQTATFPSRVPGPVYKAGWIKKKKVQTQRKRR